MISIKGGTGTVFVLSLISEDIHYTRQVFVFILGCYKLRISTVPAGCYLLSALVFELSLWLCQQCCLLLLLLRYKSREGSDEVRGWGEAMGDLWLDRGRVAQCCWNWAQKLLGKFVL